MDLAQFAKPTLGAIGAALGACFGNVVNVIVWLMLLMVIDLISALIANGKAGKLDPTVGYLGWRRKTITLLVILGLAVLQHLGHNAGITNIPAAETIAGGFALIEFVSILRNFLLVGGILPDALADAFPGLRAKVDKAKEQEPVPHG